MVYAASCAGPSSPDNNLTKCSKTPALASMSWLSGLSWHKFPNVAAACSMYSAAEPSFLPSIPTSTGTTPASMQHALTSSLFCPTPASVKTSSKSNAAEQRECSPSMRTNGSAMSYATCGANSSSFLIFSDNSHTAFASLRCKAFTISSKWSGVLETLSAGLAVDEAEGLPPSTWAAPSTLASSTFASSISCRVRPKRSHKKSSAISTSSEDNLDCSLLASPAASASINSGHMTGLGVKSTHLPAFDTFHQYLSATNAELLGKSKCSKTAHPRTVAMPVAFSTCTAFAKL
mmetsp:Transcript_108842/g.306728  ORF Transcript_108842/g.306728 Transcript_108842/m.306728 type:complete len:290 (-) Transcript_108842:505-1374(-)